VSSEVGRPKWVEQLRLLPQLVESLPPRLRHGRRVAPAHLIAAQYYCEVQVELELAAGEAITPERGEGRLLHELLLAMRSVEREELIGRIISGRRCACRFPLLAEVEDVPVAGLPDAVVFERGKPVEVTELKTVEVIPPSPWRDHVVQAWVYGLLPDLMGFDCSELRLSVRYVRRGWEPFPLLEAVPLDLREVAWEALEKKHLATCGHSS